MGGSISGGDILFRILGDNSGLKKALQDSEVDIEGITGKIGVFGAAITAALGSTVYAWVKIGSQIDEFSQRTGIAAEDVSVLRYALDQSGSSLDAMGSSLVVLAKNMQDAKGSTAGLNEEIAGGEERIGQYESATENLKIEIAAAKAEAQSLGAEQKNLNSQIADAERQFNMYGEASGFTAQQIENARRESIMLGNSQQQLEQWMASAGKEMVRFGDEQSSLKDNLGALKEKTSETADNLERIGLSYQTLATMTPNEQFLAIGFALSTMTDPMERAAIGSQLLGKVYSQLIPLFNEGAGGMAAFKAEAEKLGIVMSGEEAAKAEAFGDTIGMIKASFEGLMIQIGPVVAEIIEGLIPALMSAAEWLKTFIAENPDFIKGFLEAAVATGGLSMAIGALGFVIGPLAGIANITSLALRALSAAGLIGTATAATSAAGAMVETSAAVAGAGVAAEVAGGGLTLLGLTAAGFVAGGAVLGMELIAITKAFYETAQAEAELDKSFEKTTDTIFKYADSVKGTSEEIDIASMKGMTLDEAIAQINETSNKARIEQRALGVDVDHVGDSFEASAAPMGTAADFLQLLAQNSAQGQAAMREQTAQTWAFVDAIIAMNNAISTSPPMPSGNAMPGPMFPGFDTGIPLGMASGLGRGASGAGENTAPGGNSVTINITVSGGMAAGEDANALSNKLGNEIVSRLRAVGVA